MACLDTSALLDLAGHSGRRVCERVQERVRELHAAGQALATTRLTVAELWVGIHRARDKKREFDRVRTLLEPLVVLTRTAHPHMRGQPSKRSRTVHSRLPRDGPVR